MKVGMYTLDADDLEMFRDSLPEYMIDRAYERGFFTIGAVDESEEESGDDALIGVAQFYINITPQGECFAELIYVYVKEDARRDGIGTKLIERVNRILKKSGIKVCTLLLDVADDDAGYGIPVEEIEEFLQMCSFRKTKEDINTWATVLDDVYASLSEEEMLRYVRLAGR